VLQGLKATLAQLGLKVFKAFKETKVFKVEQGQLALLEIKAAQEPLVRLAFKVMQVQRALQALLEFKVFKVRLA
jgi:hypothetical protein